MSNTITLEDLKKKEEVAILQGIAMMSYNPSIGRVFEKGGVNIFQELITENIEKLHSINSISDFDNFHDSLVEMIINNIKSSRQDSIVYGQAQKPLNVFFKAYIDWSGLPNMELAEKLREFLHVPLDSILMSEVKENFSQEYLKFVVPTYDQIRAVLKEKMSESGEPPTDSIINSIINPTDFSLKGIIYKSMYYAWQKCCRSIYPAKPVILDVLWSIKRKE